MDVSQILSGQFLAAREKAYENKHNPFFINPGRYAIAPFRIADNLYYVGDKKVCIHLIDSGDGLILIDSGYPACKHMLIDSIWRAGFDPADVKWILHTHGHYDHFGASEEFRTLFGTKLAIGAVDAQALRDCPERALTPADDHYTLTPVFDRELADGEVFELGAVKIRCVLSPGHTVGVLSFFFDVTEGGKTYRAGLFGGAGTNALKLPQLAYCKMPFNEPEIMLRTIERLLQEPVTLHLGNHPYNNHTLEKREQQLLAGGNPFLGPESWPEFLHGLEENIHRIQKENEELLAKLQAEA